MRGRPLRFLMLVLGGWTAGRAVLLWPTADALAPAASRAVAAIDLPPYLARPRFGAPPSPIEDMAPARSAHGSVDTAPIIAPTEPPLAEPQPDPDRVALALAAMVPYGPEQVDPDPAIPPPLAPTPRAAGTTRWAGSAWAIARGGRTDALAGGQLGGSQAGARLTYALDRTGKVALAARASAPFAGRGQEAAVGIEWRPLAVPVRLLAERRFAVDGGRGGAAIVAVAGLPPTRVAGLTAEAYGQAGAVEHRGGFADGAARLTRRLGAQRLRLDLGIGSWGGMQRDAARLDIGPTVGLGVPLGRQRVRLTLDWRVRVTGDARPGTGPALSIGSDF